MISFLARLLSEYMFQLVIAEFLFLSYRERKPGFIWRFPALFILIVFGYDLITASTPALIALNVLAMSFGIFLWFAITLFALRLCYNCTFQEIVFCSVGAYAVQNFAHNLRMWFHTYFGIVRDTIESLATTVIIFALVYSVSYALYLKKIKTFKITDIKEIHNWSISIVVILLTTFFPILFKASENSNNLLLLLYALTSDVLVLCVQFELLNERNLKNQNSLMEQVLIAGQRQYQMSKENIELINMKCHDLKYQIAALRTIKSEEVKNESIAEIERAVSIYDSSLKSGNDTLDVILMEKSLYAERYNIKFSCIADGARLDFIRPYDIYAIFGNILDNAIESAVRETDEGKRIISVNIGAKSKMLSLHIENYCSHTPTFVGGRPQSTKGDSRIHGYGIPSVRYIVNKYKGNVVVTYEDNIFAVNILIPIPEVIHKVCWDDMTEGNK